MQTELEVQLNSLTEEKRLSFYELLSHNLTIAIRTIWSNEAVQSHERLDRIKWVNEILHQVTSKVRFLRLNTNQWTDRDFVRTTHHWISQNDAIRGDVGWAVRTSLEEVQKAA